MKLNLKSAASGLTALAVAGGVLLTSAGVALAGPTSSPYDPPVAQTTLNNNGATQGFLSFYSDAGTRITGGTLAAPPGFIKADTDAGRPGDTLATAFIATPLKGQPAQAWGFEQISAGDSYRTASLPGQASDGTALVDSSFMWTQELNVPNTNSDTAWQDLYQVRLYTSGPGQALDDTRYASATVSVDPAAGTWTQIYPTPPAPATAPDAPTAVTASPQQNAASVSFTAPANTGGAPITSYTVTSAGATVATATGPSSPITVTGLAPGSHTFTVTATNSAGTSAPSAASAPVTVTGPPAPGVALSVAGGPTASDPYTFTASVNPAAAAGSVAFFDGASTTPLTGTAGGSAGTYTLSGVALSAGAHSIVAKFTPTDTTAYSSSSSQAQSFFTQGAVVGDCALPGSVCVDDQTIQVEVPAGSLVIETPYTPANPLNLGVMTLNQANKMYTANAPFQNIVVTDLRAGDLPWEASARSGGLSNGSDTINGQNVGLTSLTAVAGAGFDATAANLTMLNNPAADPAVAAGATGNLGLGGSAAHAIARATIGSGTVTMAGTLTINAPTSTDRGVYTGLVTFTIG